MEQSPEHPHHRTDRHCHHLWSHLVHRNDELKGRKSFRLHHNHVIQIGGILLGDVFVLQMPCLFEALITDGYL